MGKSEYVLKMRPTFQHNICYFHLSSSVILLQKHISENVISTWQFLQFLGDLFGVKRSRLESSPTSGVKKSHLNSAQRAPRVASPSTQRIQDPKPNAKVRLKWTTRLSRTCTNSFATLVNTIKMNENGEFSIDMLVYRTGVYRRHVWVKTNL